MREQLRERIAKIPWMMMRSKDHHDALDGSDQIIEAIVEMVRDIENPYTGNTEKEAGRYIGWDSARQAIISKLEER